MSTLEKEPVRARVTVAGLSIETPDVVSFNVNRSRKQMCATFSASLKIDNRTLSRQILDGKVTIEAGAYDLLNTIFTGIVEKASISPIRSDASKMMLNISGRDVLMKLEGKNITRRASDTSLPLFAVVNSVIRHDLQKMQKFNTRVYSHKPHVLVDMGDLPRVSVADAFNPGSLPDRSRSSKTVGFLSIEKLPKSNKPDSQNSEDDSQNSEEETTND